MRYKTLLSTLEIRKTKDISRVILAPPLHKSFPFYKKYHAPNQRRLNEFDEFFFPSYMKYIYIYTKISRKLIVNHEYKINFDIRGQDNDVHKHRIIINRKTENGTISTSFFEVYFWNNPKSREGEEKGGENENGGRRCLPTPLLSPLCLRIIFFRGIKI